MRAVFPSKPSFAASLLAAPSLAVSALAVSLLAVPLPAGAAGATTAPQAIGSFGAWQAATREEKGEKICYAFTRPTASVPAIPKRQPVVLTVTERPTLRDTVAVSAGFAYPKNTTVTASIDQTTLDFYTTEGFAFARDGHTAVAAFQRGHSAVVHTTAPGRTQVADSFSLTGFSAAYQAVLRACPAR